MAISDHVRNQSRTKITSEVDSIARLPTKASTDTKDEEEKSKRHHVSSIDIVGVSQSKDTEHENAAGDEFREEHACPSHKRGRICAKDPGRCGRASHRPDTSAALKGIKSRLIVAIHDSGTNHGSEKLSKGVDRQLAPGVAAVQTVGKSHRWVEVTTRFTANKDTEHDGNSIAKRC